VVLPHFFNVALEVVDIIDFALDDGIFVFYIFFQNIRITFQGIILAQQSNFFFLVLKNFIFQHFLYFGIRLFLFFELSFIIFS